MSNPFPHQHQPLLFLNLPTVSFPQSLRFYTTLGFVQNHHFSEEENGIAMVSLPPLLPLNTTTTTKKPNPISPINIMLMPPSKFEEFLPQGNASSPENTQARRDIINPRTQIQVLPCVTAGSIEEVDGWVERAVKAGGRGDVCKRVEMRMSKAELQTEPGKCKEGEAKVGKEEGEIVMYGRSFEDLDGNIWEVNWMSEGFVAGTLGEEEGRSG